MLDLAFLALTGAFFALSGWFLRFSDGLMPASAGERAPDESNPSVRSR